MRSPRLLALLVVLLVSVPAASAGTARVPIRHVLLGHSLHGRPIRAVVVGDRSAKQTVLVVGCVHGNECAGAPILTRLKYAQPPPGVALWLVPTMNPDGRAAGTRGNGPGRRPEPHTSRSTGRTSAASITQGRTRSRSPRRGSRGG